ncbi:MAG: tetratricopeptide repeat protein [Armatimonadota bacterium]
MRAACGAADEAWNAGVDAVANDQWCRALAHFEAVTALRPDDTEAIKAAAACQARLGKLTDAIRRWQSVHAADPDDEQAKKVMAAVHSTAKPGVEEQARIRLLLEAPPTDD